VGVTTTGFFSMGGGLISGNRGSSTRASGGTFYLFKNDMLNMEATGSAYYGKRDGNTDYIIPSEGHWVTDEKNTRRFIIDSTLENEHDNATIRVNAATGELTVTYPGV
jgi:hypothetical protein